METFRRSVAYVVSFLAVLFGGGSLMAFLLFLLAGSPELINLKLHTNEVLWWDAGLSMAFFIQHSGMVRRSVRQRLAHFLPLEYESAIYAIASGIVLLALIVLWQKSFPVFTVSRGVFRWLFYVVYLLSFTGFIWGISTESLRSVWPQADLGSFEG